ncbi:MAG: hypothetical protein ACRDPY_06195, partial [Streptosporangiaceae bacterium]
DGGRMPQERLFTGLRVNAIRSQAIDGVSPAVARFTEGQLRGNSLDDLARYVGDVIMGQPLELNTGNHSYEHQVVPLAELDVPAPNGAHSAVDVIRLSLHIPYTGTRTVFKTQPSRVLGTPNPEAALTDDEAIVTIAAGPDEDGPAAEARLLLLEQNLQQWVNTVNDEVADLKRELCSHARTLIRKRLYVLRQRDNIVAALTIPLRRVEADRAVEIPIKRTTVALKSTTPAAAGQREWSLADSVYEQMIKTITAFTHALERRPASALRLLPETETQADEETLRDWLLFILGSNYEAPGGGELFIGGEVENGKGKTDILVRHEGWNAFIGECKFWHGPKKFNEAIEQLLGYTTWRDTKAAIILFITNQNATAAIDSAGACLAAHSACREVLNSPDPRERRDYRFSSPTDKQRIIWLALLPVVL